MTLMLQDIFSFRISGRKALPISPNSILGQEGELDTLLLSIRFVLTSAVGRAKNMKTSMEHEFREDSFSKCFQIQILQGCFQHGDFAFCSVHSTANNN